MTENPSPASSPASVEQTTMTTAKVAALSISMQKRLDKVPGEPFGDQPVTIFRFSSRFRETNKDICEPKMVSIGPYHHGKESLRAMEDHKWSSLRDFLARSPNVGLEGYLWEMRAIEAQARMCYSETVNLESDDFVTMLLLDSCFILEFFLKGEHGQSDVICDVGWSMVDILSDIVLFENQIPFFVIRKLFAILEGDGYNHYSLDPLLKLFSKYFNIMLSNTELSPSPVSYTEIYHLLHLYYTRVVADLPTQREQRNLVSGKPHSWGLINIFPWLKVLSKSSNAALESAEPRDVESADLERLAIPRASELQEAGLIFKRKKGPCHMFDISFENGIMEMPYMLLNNLCKVLFFNMVAFEQTQPYTLNRTLMSYAFLMRALINTKKDVAILQQSGILESLIESDEDAAAFFDHKGILFVLAPNENYFRGLFQELQKCSNSTCLKYRAKLIKYRENLMSDYFSSPWSLISVVAAGILLVLTFIQTIYAVK